MYCRIGKIPHLPEFPILLDLFHIKINDDSCSLLFDNHFISLDPKYDSKFIQSKDLVTMSASLCTQTRRPNLTIQVLNIKSQLRYIHNVIS